MPSKDKGDSGSAANEADLPPGHGDDDPSGDKVDHLSGDKIVNPSLSSSKSSSSNSSASVPDSLRQADAVSASASRQPLSTFSTISISPWQSTTTTISISPATETEPISMTSTIQENTPNLSNEELFPLDESIDPGSTTSDDNSKTAEMENSESMEVGED